jgi:hypothetical protein
VFRVLQLWTLAYQKNNQRYRARKTRHKSGPVEFIPFGLCALLFLVENDLPNSKTCLRWRLWLGLFVKGVSVVGG